MLRRTLAGRLVTAFGDPVEDGAVLYSLEGDFGFSPPNATAPAPEVGHEIKLINFDFAKYGSSEERKRLLSKWDNEVKNLPK